MSERRFSSKEASLVGLPAVGSNHDFERNFATRQVLNPTDICTEFNNSKLSSSQAKVRWGFSIGGTIC